MFEHCEYNPFTLTGRPSNHFNNINYAALTKDQRERFRSRHDKGFLIEIDLSGFHLYLLYIILGLEFPKNIYEELSKYYPSEVDPKEFTFKQIYGGIDKSLLEITPFKEIQELQWSIYQKYRNNELKTFLFDRKVSIPDLSSTKIFNYMLQNLETEFNDHLIDKLLDLLDQKETKLILYTYDSFLFDFSLNDGMNLINDIIDVFETVPFHLKAGYDYKNMKTMNISK